MKLSMSQLISRFTPRGVSPEKQKMDTSFGQFVRNSAGPTHLPFALRFVFRPKKPPALFRPIFSRTQAWDAVAICSGLHNVPRIPSFPGLATRFRLAKNSRRSRGYHYRSPSDWCPTSHPFFCGEGSPTQLDTTIPVSVVWAWFGVVLGCLC